MTPLDPPARYANQGSQAWEGCKVQLTETVEEEAPRLITDVRTTPATQSDSS